MPQHDATTRTMTVSEVKGQLSSLVNEVYREETRVLVEKSGIPVAALVSAADLARLEQLDRDWDEGTKALERFSQAFADIPVDELEARIADIIAENRRRARTAAERQTA